MNEQVQSYWENYNKATSEESGSGGGIISRARVETGYKVFAGGVPQNESWFPAAAGDKAARAQAKKEAKTMAGKHGCNFYWGIAICTPTAHSYKQGEKATWNTEEMVRFTASFWDSCNEIVIPSLKEHKLIADGKERWLRLGFKPDPNPKAKKDDQGRVGQIAYVTEVFKNPKLARKAISEMPKGDAKADVPDGYSADDWNDEELQDAIKLALESQDVDEVAEDYGVDPKYIQAIADTVVPV